MTPTGSEMTCKKGGIKRCTPGRASRKSPIKHDERCYKRRSRIHTMFGRPKDRRAVTILFDRCRKIFLSAVALVVTAMFWLGALSVGLRVTVL